MPEVVELRTPSRTSSAALFSPAVTYWTAQWNPSREAVSKEVALLRSSLSPESPVVCFGNAQRTRLLAGERVLQLAADRWLLLRGVAALLERRGAVTHVAGDGSWHLLRALGRRPLVLTLMIPSDLPSTTLLDRVSLFVAESEALHDTLLAHGVDERRVRIVYPGIDLARFSVAPLPTDRFRLIFASAPAHVSEFQGRGIPLMIELARRRPDIELLMLWRNWDDATTTAEAFRALDPPANVVIERGDLTDMNDGYARAHATICCFEAGAGKSSPNSVLEGLAAGRPALVTRECGIAGLIGRAGAGAVCERSVEALSDGVDRLMADLPGLSARARLTAEAHFDHHEFLRRYAAIYRDLAA